MIKTIEKLSLYLLTSLSILCTLTLAIADSKVKDGPATAACMIFAILSCMLALSGVKHILNDDKNSNTKQ